TQAAVEQERKLREATARLEKEGQNAIEKEKHIRSLQAELLCTKDAIAEHESAAKVVTAKLTSLTAELQQLKSERIRKVDASTDEDKAVKVKQKIEFIESLVDELHTI